MKSTIKLFLILVLFSSVAFAEGDMGTGGRTCPNGQNSCLVVPEPTETTTETEDSVWIIIQEYLNSVFNYFENQE